MSAGGRDLKSKPVLKNRYQFQSVTDDAVIIRTNGADQTVSRSSVERVSSRHPGHRGRHVLIGAGIGAGAGLGTGAAIDNNCTRQSIVCTGNKGKAILTPVFGLIGAGIGALLPAGRLAGSLSFRLGEARLALRALHSPVAELIPHPNA